MGDPGESIKLFFYPIIFWAGLIVARPANLLLLWNLTESSLLSGPPYNWNSSQVGCAISYLFGEVVLLGSQPLDCCLTGLQAAQHEQTREFARQVFEANFFGGSAGNEHTFVQGAKPEPCTLAVESCSRAFSKWSKTTPGQRRSLFHALAKVCDNSLWGVRYCHDLLIPSRSCSVTVPRKSCLGLNPEINCSEKWSDINLQDSVALIEEVA